MQKAMGEKLGEAEDADAEQRRQNLLRQALTALCAAVHCCTNPLLSNMLQ